jgi:hypothetical protein
VRAKLTEEQRAISHEDDCLTSQERELDIIESELAEHELRMRRITTCHKSKTDIDTCTTALRKTAAALRAQLELAEKELDDARARVRVRRSVTDDIGEAARHPRVSRSPQIGPSFAPQAAGRLAAGERDCARERRH